VRHGDSDGTRAGSRRPEKRSAGHSSAFERAHVVLSAARQLRQLPFYQRFAYKTHNVAVDLAERLIGIMPAKMSRVFFNNSSSEANDTAAKLVSYYNYARG